jgi:hypothetical protein
MIPRLVIVGGIPRRNPAQVRFAQDYHVVDALAPDGSDQSFGEAIIRYVGRRCLTCSADLRGLASKLGDSVT